VLQTVRGNLLESDVEALVNTVNTVGIMGKGIALQFKRTFPENLAAYERACKAGTLEPGRVFTFQQAHSKTRVTSLISQESGTGRDARV
jgi:O-acetyl-ADP-ribose deacetylase (regulator of RNase III)